MSKKQTCGNCRFGIFSVGEKRLSKGVCEVALVFSNNFAQYGVPIAVDADMPLNFHAVSAKQNATDCLYYQRKKES